MVDLLVALFLAIATCAVLGVVYIVALTLLQVLAGFAALIALWIAGDT